MTTQAVHIPPVLSMAEPPPKRPRKSDVIAERRRESPSRKNPQTRDQRGPRDDRGGRGYHDRDSHKERERRYRSRSRSRERIRDRDRDRDRHERGGRRDDVREKERDRDRPRQVESIKGITRDQLDGSGTKRERDYKESRGAGRDDRDRERGHYRDRDPRDRRERKRPREDDGERTMRPTRSRSPAREMDSRRSRSPLHARTLESDDFDRSKNRTATPPVAFRVGPGIKYDSHGQQHKEFREANGVATKSPAPIPGLDSSTYAADLMDTENPSSKKSKSKTAKRSKSQATSKMDIDEIGDEYEDIIIEDGGDEMAAMQAMLGVSGFGTTKQKKVQGNDVYAVRKEKKTEYRQYMNRVGGFNRPLSPSRE